MALVQWTAMTRVRPCSYLSSKCKSSNNYRPIMSTSTSTSTSTSRAVMEVGVDVCGGGVDKYLPSLHKSLEQQPYKAFPVIGWNRHLETIFASFFRSLPTLTLKRECIRTSDDGAVALDWVAGDHINLPPNSPTLILLPGLTGGSADTYVRHMLIRARNLGWRVLVFNSRGCANSPVTTPQFYSASFTGDITQVVAHVAARYPQANLYAVGWSLGANILVRYLAQESHNCSLAGAVSLCNPFNLPIADEDFRKGFNNIYDKALANSLRKIFRVHAALFEDIGGDYNIPMVANAKTVKEFDEGLTRVSFGFKSADDYYLHSSSADSIKYVQTPLLCIQAANDPIAPARGIPRKAIEENENCVLIITPKGGHLGWVAGNEAPFGAPWTDPCVMDFLQHLEKSSAEVSSVSSQSKCGQPYTGDLLPAEERNAFAWGAVQLK